MLPLAYKKAVGAQGQEERAPGRTGIRGCLSPTRNPS
jgi:hypothetical protein